MSYLALARKWRPQSFSQLLGQEHVSKALCNALNQQRIHHAYLFTGTRGVGKTSIARILAKALNCETGISATPCLVCETCIAIEQGHFIDLIEIDGASKTRVEDTRELLDNIPYAPTSGRFKIYLIDEVHMLSSHSFNALLKTLEEPPAHVKFILATTDPQKLPITVLSRCLQFHLRHIMPVLICQQLHQILKAETLEYDIKALEIIAQSAQGSMRDALTLLDQAITSCDEKLQELDVKKLLGYTQKDYALMLLQALSEQNSHLLIGLTNEINLEGGHFQYVLNELITYLHQIAVYQNVGEDNTLVEYSSDIKQLANLFNPEDIQLFYQIAIRASEEIHLAPTLAIGFSMTMLRMLTFRPITQLKAPPLTFAKTSPVIPATSNQESPPSILEDALQTSILVDHEIKSGSKMLEDIAWVDLIPKLKLTGLALSALENAEFISMVDNEISLALAKGHESLFTPSTKIKIEKALGTYYNQPINLILKKGEATQTSPAQQRTKAVAEKQKQAEESLAKDPQFQKIKQEFSAELVKNSIVPLKNSL